MFPASDLGRKKWLGLRCTELKYRSTRSLSSLPFGIEYDDTGTSGIPSLLACSRSEAGFWFSKRRVAKLAVGVLSLMREDSTVWLNGDVVWSAAESLSDGLLYVFTARGDEPTGIAAGAGCGRRHLSPFSRHF